MPDADPERRRRQIPYVMPNVDLPVMGDGDFYAVNYSAGVLLEAEFMAVKLPASTKRVVQVFRADDIGAAAVKSRVSPPAFRSTMSRSSLSPERRRFLPPSAAICRTVPAEALMLWLRPEDLRRLPAAGSSANVYVSGLMGGADAIDAISRAFPAVRIIEIGAAAQVVGSR